MKKILFATENPAKAKRFSKVLLEKGIEIVTLNDISTSIVVEENGKDAIENALLKAKAYLMKQRWLQWLWMIICISIISQLFCNPERL